MAGPIPFDPARFAGAAEDYLAGRAAYAEALVPRVAQLAGLGATDRVMDLGCGPGPLACAFAPLCAEVLAIDPEPGMLHAARAQAAGVAGRILFRQGSSYDLAMEMGRFRLVVIGRAFHWMDRADTLARLDALIEPGGAVILFSTATPALPENGWHLAFRDLMTRFQAEGSARTAMRGPHWVPHETVLLDSRFGRLESVTLTERRRTRATSLLRRALSMSSTSRARVGERAEQLERELMAAMAPFAVDGVVTEVVDSVALIATRS